MYKEYVPFSVSVQISEFIDKVATFSNEFTSEVCFSTWVALPFTIDWVPNCIVPGNKTDSSNGSSSGFAVGEEGH